MKLGRFDFAAFGSFGTYAMCSLAVPMCLIPLAMDLDFPLGEGGMGLGGALQLGRAIPMVIAMLFCGFMAGRWGKRLSLGLSMLLMALGIMIASISPGYGVLFAALAVAGLGEGVIEGLVTPFVQDLHPDQPGRYMNVSHSFWSVGVLILTLTAGVLLYYGVSWRIILFATGAFAVVPALLYLLPYHGQQKIHNADPVHWKDIVRSSRDLFKSRRFWLFFVAMFFAGGGEFCLTFWCASFIQIEFGSSAWLGGAGTACFAVGMFVGRFVSGILVHEHGLKKLIVSLAIASVVFTVFYPWVQSYWVLFVLLFFSGVAAGPFWPSIQTNGAARIKGDYTVMMILFSCAGVPGCGVFSALLGVLGDAVGLRMSFLVVPACFLIVFLLMGYDYLCERAESRKATSASARITTVSGRLRVESQADTL